MPPTASVIVPCWNSGKYIGACLESLRAGGFADYEVLAVDDGSEDDTAAVLGRAAAADARVRPVFRPHAGVSAARNAGLEAAAGRTVFFVDPDDTVAPGFLSKGVALLDGAGADFGIFGYAVRKAGEPEAAGECDAAGDGGWRTRPLRASYDLRTPEAIRAEFLPRVFGHSLARVREWNRGAPLFGRRELGSVCRCVFRRDFLERHRIRFDETLALNEDAMFLCEAALAATSMASLDEPLYRYLLRPEGAHLSVDAGRGMVANKLRLLRKREELDRKEGGTLADAYLGSCVFSLLELLHLARSIDIPWTESHRVVAEYAADPVVRRALARFPLSWRHPLVAFLVLLLRLRLAVPLHALVHALFLPARRLGRRRPARYAGIR